MHPLLLTIAFTVLVPPAYATTGGSMADRILGLTSIKSPAQNEVTPAQTGTASYYARRFHGRRTASGEYYDERDLTAAHRGLPFGTLVRVTHLANDRQVVVRVNDRGPYTRGRILDLSRRAARELGFVGTGTAKVRLEVLGIEGGNQRAGGAVQKASFAISAPDR
jgi:rare lipoprotein A